MKTSSDQKPKSKFQNPNAKPMSKPKARDILCLGFDFLLPFKL